MNGPDFLALQALVARLAQFYVMAKRFEGCKLVPYLCPARVWTCGWGSTGRDVIPGRPWTQAYADKRLEQDGLRFALGVLKACPNLIHESDARLCAVTDWTYNLGETALKASTFRKRVAAGLWAAAARECRRWIHGGGKVLRGLVIRRDAEAIMLERG